MNRMLKTLVTLIVAMGFFFAAGAVDAKEAHAHVGWGMKVNVVCDGRNHVWHHDLFTYHDFFVKDRTRTSVIGTLQQRRAGLSPTNFSQVRIDKSYVRANTNEC